MHETPHLRMVDGAPMSLPDLNLLVALDALLIEGNVARAAKRLRLSPSAMSRTLARLRESTGDPLLVRAGRGLVPTPRALKLAGQVGPLVEQAVRVLRPQERVMLKTVRRTFRLRTSDGFVENFGAALLERVIAEAPHISIQFIQKVSRDSGALRDGTVDLETGVIGGALGPEVMTLALFHDRSVGVVRNGHPLCRVEMSAARYAAAGHILVSRGEVEKGPIDAGLERLRLERTITTTVTGFAAALALARGTDLVATVPERHTDNMRVGLHTFALPFKTRVLTVSLLWHPRHDKDPVHRWLRECVRAACAASSLKEAG